MSILGRIRIITKKSQLLELQSIPPPAGTSRSGSRSAPHNSADLHTATALSHSNMEGTSRKRGLVDDATRAINKKTNPFEEIIPLPVGETNDIERLVLGPVEVEKDPHSPYAFGSTVSLSQHAISSENHHNLMGSLLYLSKHS